MRWVYVDFGLHGWETVSGGLRPPDGKCLTRNGDAHLSITPEMCAEEMFVGQPA